jgi:hypothetical protein
MVNEADRFADEDKAKREAVETKNNAESMVYQTEKQIKELGDKVRGSWETRSLVCGRGRGKGKQGRWFVGGGRGKR